MASKALHHELTEAELNAPDLDEGERDVETFLMPDASGIADPYLREVWEDAVKALNNPGE